MSDNIQYKLPPITGTLSKDFVRGYSAYDFAVQQGFEGTLEEWLESLHGKDGKDGTDGKDGRDGINGRDGIDGIDGQDGKSVEIREVNGVLQWRYMNDDSSSWQNIYDFNSNISAAINNHEATSGHVRIVDSLPSAAEANPNDLYILREEVS